jgi:putative transcriptional regulator
MPRSAQWEAERLRLCIRCAAASYTVSSAREEPVVVKEQLIRHRPGIDPKPQARTDWGRVDKMTDEEVEAAALTDPDAQPLTDEELARAFRPGRLVALRKRLGLDQPRFAERFRIDLQTLNAWERAMAVPDDIARVYLQVTERNPEAVAAALVDCSRPDRKREHREFDSNSFWTLKPLEQLAAEQGVQPIADIAELDAMRAKSLTTRCRIF